VLVGQALLVTAMHHYQFDTRHIGERVVDAINCGSSPPPSTSTTLGGVEHTDSNGVRYRRDPLDGKQGVASDFGRRLIIHKAHRDDQLLFQVSFID